MYTYIYIYRERERETEMRESNIWNWSLLFENVRNTFGMPSDDDIAHDGQANDTNIARHGSKLLCEPAKISME